MENTVIAATRPLFDFYCLVGLSPTAASSREKIKLTFRGILGSVFAFTLIVLFAIVIALNLGIQEMILAYTYFANIILQVQFAYAISTATISIIREFVFRNRIYQILITMKDIDEVIMKNGGIFKININHKTTRKNVVIYMIVIIAFYVFIIVQDNLLITYSSFVNDIFNVVKVFGFYYMKEAVMFFTYTKFILLCYLIRQRFCWINEHLSQNYQSRIAEGKINTSSYGSSNETPEGIKLTCQLHRKLCESLKEFNACYSLQIMLFMALIFLAVTKQYFYIILVFLDVPNVETGKDTISRIIWSLYHMFLLLMVAVVCQYTSTEAKRTGELLHTVLYTGPNNTQANKLLQLYSLQILHSNPSFTVGGLVSIDMTLIKSMVGSITTYLVILVQFHMK